MAQPPILKQGPEPVETADLHFKLICKLKVFEPVSKYEDGNCNLLAVSQHYGLVFIGNLNGFSVIKSKSISAGIDSNSFPKRDIVLSLKPSHLSVDTSQKVLAVVCKSKPGSMLIMYNISSFLTKDAVPLKVTPLSKVIQNPAAEVIDLAWQPNTDGGLMLCMSDGSVLALSQGSKEGPVLTLPSAAQATCFCWSPKGKQIVIGSAVGTISQYKPDLKLVKTLPAPPLFNGSVTVVSVLWISSYQFAVAYNDRNSPESFPVIAVVNAAKNEPINVINYDDITYSSTLFRHHQIFMNHQSSWNLIFVSSANSIEVAVLHSNDNLTWEQWLLGDASRAELPLNPDRQETFPLGLAFDYTSENAIPWGEGTLPPMPRLLLLSDEGLLCIFHIVNISQNAPQLCSAPKEFVDDSLFVTKSAPLPSSEPPAAAQLPKTFVQPSTVSSAAPASIFGNSKPTFTFGGSPGFGGFTAKPISTVPQSTAPLQTSVKDAPPVVLQPQQQPFQQRPQQQPTPVLSAQTPSLKPATTQPHFGAAPTFSFGMSNTASLFGAKAAAAQQIPSSETSIFIKTAPKFTVSQTEGSALKTSSPTQDLFSNKTLFQSTPIKQPEVTQTTVVKTTPKPPVAAKKEEVIESTAAVEEPAKGKSPAGSPSPATPEVAVVDDSVYLTALQEEVEHFNSELQQLSTRMRSLEVKVGTEEDKIKMKKRIDGLYDFWKELKETTEGQNGEIHSVVMDLMESFAWLEDAKSRNLQRKNPSFIELKKSEELDPLSARHMTEIGHLKYYIENQLKQLTNYLEKEWMDHQENYRMAVKNSMAVPPLEEVYKTMHYQLKILNKQRSLVEELKEKMSARKKKGKSHAPLIISTAPPSHKNNRVSELSKLAENLLQLKINREDRDPKFENWEMMKAQLKAISERSKKLSSEKQSALRDMLSERDMVKIRPVKTTFESSSFLRSLPTQKTVLKTPKQTPNTYKPSSEPKEKEKIPSSPVKTKTPASPKQKTEVKEKPKVEKPVAQEKIEPKKPETPKRIFVFGGVPAEKPMIPLLVQSLPNKPEEKSPLASLSGIVSSIGKENEVKPKPATVPFSFGIPNVEKQEVPKQNISKLDKNVEEVKPPQTFNFHLPKPSETMFGKNEPPKFGTKPTFGLVSSTTPTTIVSTAEAKPATVKTTSTEVSATATSESSSTPVTTSISTTFKFTFPSGNTTSAPTLTFSASEQTPIFGSKPATNNLFSLAPTTTQTTPALLFSSPVLRINKTETTTTLVFSTPKTTSESTPQVTGFTFTQQPEIKVPPPKESSPVVTIKPTAETEEVEILNLEITPKKSEAEAPSKNSPKPSAPINVIFGTAPEPPKASVEVTTTPSSTVPPNVQVVSAAQITVPSCTANIFSKPPTTTSAETPTTSAPTVSQPTTTTTTTSGFSFATSSSPTVFGQTNTPTATTTGRLFAQAPSTTVGIFEQVPSTTPTTNIFGGGTPTTPISNIFGGSTPTKPIFGQAASTLTSSTESIFEGSTPTSSTFGQPSTPTSTPAGFGQKTDAVETNIFGQLLSDSNRTSGGFGTSAGTPTTSIFTTPKNIFGGGGASTTTASLFATTSSSVFGQPTTTSTIVFGQATPTSSSVFGQNICSPFGGGTQSTFGGDSGGFNSKPIFGQSLFGQSTTASNTIFGGSPNSSIFGGASTSPSGGNVFQTPTTSTTFGSSSPGPFSSGGSVAETGFGAASSTMQKPLGGFGSPPVFGGAPTIAPAFGAAPTFSGSTSFGSLPAFGNRPFDSSQSTFGQSSGSSTFENLANQNTVGFRNLAQQSQGQGFGGFGSSSFENKTAFGGNSFSSWRSK